MRAIYRTDRLVLKPSISDDIQDHLAATSHNEAQFRIPNEISKDNDLLSDTIPLGCVEEALGVWTIFEKEPSVGTDRFIGWIQLLPLAGEGPEIEIGYRLIQQAQGHGFASEAARVIRDHAFEKANLQSICAVTDPDNNASQQVLQKIGMTIQPEPEDGEQEPKFYTLSRDDWTERRLKS